MCFLEPNARKAFSTGRIQIVPYLEADWNNTSITEGRQVKEAEVGFERHFHSSVT